MSNNELSQASMDDKKKLDHGYEKPLETLLMAKLLFLACPNPEGADEQWRIVKPEDVPEFAKAPDVIQRLVSGDMCEWPVLGLWLRAEQIDE